eukprot:8167994-Pyramimonas_sp.AAC.2
MLKYYRPRPALTEKRRLGDANEVKQELHKLHPHTNPDQSAPLSPPAQSVPILIPRPSQDQATRTTRRTLRSERAGSLP